MIESEKVVPSCVCASRTQNPHTQTAPGLRPDGPGRGQKPGEKEEEEEEEGWVLGWSSRPEASPTPSSYSRDSAGTRLTKKRPKDAPLAARLYHQLMLKLE